MTTQKLGSRAIVVGGGFAGLLSAAQLSPFFDEVVLLEKDRLAEGPQSRQGLPQANHHHTLRPGALEIIEDLLPGFKKTLGDHGALPTVTGKDLYYYQAQSKSYYLGFDIPEPFDMGDTQYTLTRNLLDYCIRQHVETFANVRIETGTIAVEPVHNQGEVAGLVVEKEQAQSSLEAELIVDASGRASRIDKWLKRMGYDAPEESVVNSNFAHTSVFVKPKDFNAFEGSCFIVAPDNSSGINSTRGSLLSKVEEGKWIVCCCGRFGDFPPRDYEGMMEWLRTQDNPKVYEFAKDAEPLNDPAHFRFPKGRRRHFEKLNRLPQGLLAIGDIICNYNPLFGQGMAAAARQVMQLGNYLNEAVEAGGLKHAQTKHFFAQASEEIRAPWLISCLSEFANPECTGDFPVEEVDTIDMFNFLVGEIAEGNQDAMRVFYRIAEMYEPLSSIFSPELVKIKNEQAKLRNSQVLA